MTESCLERTISYKAIDKEVKEKCSDHAFSLPISDFFSIIKINYRFNALEGKYNSSNMDQELKIQEQILLFIIPDRNFVEKLP